MWKNFGKNLGRLTFGIITGIAIAAITVTAAKTIAGKEEEK